MTPWKLIGKDAVINYSHGVVGMIEGAPTISSLLQETMLNMLLPRQAPGHGATSTWRLYLTTSNSGGISDVAEVGSMLAIALAMLSRTGLDGSQAKALLHELAGDDRGIRLLLGSTSRFVELAVHAKRFDPAWWSGMEQRILALPPDIWARRNEQHLHRSAHELVCEIRGHHFCRSCTETVLRLEP
ncbi:hypothetical protein BKA62DRAFT_714394 [Auriculariales sp. MPI-PUGE-AT-0066]|nr:hypothetical protein BKA62DRAFT_714394 [Auriculariales sp. MPI-PUGE-AT-0066]